MIVKEREPGSTELLSSRSSRAAEGADAGYRALLHRVVTSATFVRSERLCSLLVYVCDLTLNGRGAEINEQRIGHAVFGRPQNYDSTIDGIVRTQASRLRQRLEQYFKEEGANEAVLIVIPRGGYVPVFEPRFVKQAEPEPAATVAAVLSQRPRWRFLPWMLCAMLAFVVVLLSMRGRPRHLPAETKVHPLWSHIFSTERPALVVAADSGLVIYHNMTRRSFSLDDYLLGNYRRDPSQLNVFGTTTSARDWEVNLGNRRYTSMVDLDAILSLTELARAAGARVQVRYARDLRPNDLKTGNVILIGASEANPWVELFEHNLNFVFQDDYKTGVFSVINRQPRGDEPAHWDSRWNDPQRKVYGLVAYVPNLAGDGNVLLLEGTSMSGTEAARDFVMDDSQLLPFVKKIQLADGSVPHFEILLGTRNVSASALRNEVLAWRVTR